MQRLLAHYTVSATEETDKMTLKKTAFNENTENVNAWFKKIIIYKIIYQV